MIIPDPLNKARVCLGHRGGWWAEIETFGEIAHGAMPFLGDCAVRHMGAVLAEFEDKLFPAMAARHTDMPVVPDGAVATQNEMYRAQLAAERYLLQARAYLDCEVMNRRQHNLLLTRMEIFADALREAQVEFQVRDNMLAGK